MGVFNGQVMVEKEAQKTNAFQANNNVLTSDKATINTKPQLKYLQMMSNARMVVQLVN